MRKGVLINLTEDLHKKLKLYSYLNNVSMQSVVQELIEEKLETVINTRNLKQELRREVDSLAE
jgi:predicted component of type VI protein secretion system